jgi:hypothetical protein
MADDATAPPAWATNIQKLMQQYAANRQNQTTDYSQVSAPDMSKIIGMNLTKEQQKQLDLQLELANKLQTEGQKGATYEGTSVPQGSTYIPPNPLAVGMQMYSHLKGIMDSASLKDQQTALYDKMQNGFDAWQNVFQGSGMPIQNPQMEDMGLDPDSVEAPSI